MHILTTDLQSTYRALTPFKLPHHQGSLLRGLLGRALRRTACARAQGPCAGLCESPPECLSARLFDPIVPSPSPHRFLRPGTEAPPRLLPLLPPLETVSLAPGDSFRFDLRVLGALDDEGERRLLAALEAIEGLPIGATLGKVSLDTVGRRGHRNRQTTLRPQTNQGPAPHRARVTFDTPAWIEHAKELVERLTFPILFRALFRRLTMLSALYGTLDDDHEATFAALDALAARVQTIGSSLRPLLWERLSEERGERHWMRGLLGSLTFEGELSELIPVLAMGEVIHVGKSTGFGLGRMRVEVERR